jgi:hypothetical protein
MTPNVQDPSAPDVRPQPGQARNERRTPAGARPRWLLPGMVSGLVAAALVVAGVVPLSTVLYVGMFGGMLLMHLGGHGGHGRAPGGHDGHGGADEPGDRAAPAEDQGEIDQQDQPGSRGCH